MKLLKVSDVAERLNVTKLTVRLWLQAGTGPRFFTTPGGYIRISEPDLEEWIQTRTQKGGDN